MSIEQLAAGLEQMGIRQQGNHILSFKYPACDLLPADVEMPYLVVPENIAYRCAPPDGNRAHGLVDIGMAILLKRPTTTTLHNGVRTLPSMLADLSLTDGESKLDFVTYLNSWTRNLMIRFRLYTSEADSYSMHDFEMTEKEFHALTKAGGGGLQSLEMVWHIISRASDVACYHVRYHLRQQYSAAVVSWEDNRWAARWATRQNVDLREVLWQRLRPVYGHSGAFDHDRMLLPCGDVAPMCDADIREMDVMQCRNALCPECGKHILSMQDLRGFEIAIASTNNRRLAIKNAHWALLDHLPTTSVGSTTPQTLVLVLKRALRSFSTSSLVAPTPLLFAHHPLVQKIIDHWELISTRTSYPLTSTATRLFQLLEEEVKPILEAVTQPGLRDFISLWFCRTINFIFERRCELEKSNHFGIHCHSGRELWYNPGIWEDDGEGMRDSDGESDEDSGEESVGSDSKDELEETEETLETNMAKLAIQRQGQDGMCM